MPELPEVYRRLYEMVGIRIETYRENDHAPLCDSCPESWCCAMPVDATSTEIANVHRAALAAMGHKELKRRLTIWMDSGIAPLAVRLEKLLESLRTGKPTRKKLERIFHQHGDCSDEYTVKRVMCPLLVDGRCSVYNDRPYSCRKMYIAGHEPADTCYKTIHGQHGDSLVAFVPIDRDLMRIAPKMIEAVVVKPVNFNLALGLARRVLK